MAMLLHDKKCVYRKKRLGCKRRLVYLDRVRILKVDVLRQLSIE